MNNEEVRPTSNFIVSKCSAYDYLNNSNPNLEKLTTQYYETFAITGRFTGYFSNITIGDFYNNLSSIYCDSTAILGGLNSTAREQNSEKTSESSGSGSSGGGGSSSSGGSSGGGSGSSGGNSSGGGGSSSQTINPNSSEQDSKNQKDVITNPEDLVAGTSSIVGDRGTENFGIAVFNKDKLCGELTAVESICHLLIQNKVDSCIVSIDNPVSKKEDEQGNEKEKMELQIFPRENTNININLKDENPKITIDIKLHADILTLDENINYETNEVLTKISDATKDYLKNQFNDYFDKITKKYNVDIDHFGIKAPSHFLTISDWKKYNWEEKFSDSEFDVNIDVNVLSTMLVTKT